MDTLTEVRDLWTQGRFGEALRRLSSSDTRQGDGPTSDALRADLLEQVGHHSQSRTMAERLLRSKTLDPVLKSSCEYVLGRLDRENGNFQSSIEHLRRSVDLAVRAGDLERTCWSQLRLLMVLAESAGPDLVAPLLTEARANTRKLGNRQVTAALHIFVGGIEARRGLTISAARHTKIGLQLLATAPNVWLETDAEITNTATSIMLSDFESGLMHANRAAALAEQSGRAAARRASLANLGHLLYFLGHFDDAVKQYRRAIEALPTSGDNVSGVLDGLARVHLAQGRLNDTAGFVERMAESIQSPLDRRLYSNRHAIPTSRSCLPDKAAGLTPSRVSSR